MADLIYMAKSKWTALLDAIRTKGGTSASMTVDQAKAAVDAIQTGGGGITPEVPDGYTQLKFLESSGTQIINTEVAPTLETRLQVTGVRMPSQRGYNRLAGCNDPVIYIPMDDGAYGITFYCRFGNSSEVTIVTPLPCGGTCVPPTITVDKTQALFEADGASRTKDYSATGMGTVDPLTRIALFGCKKGSTYTQFTAGRIFRAKIWDDDVLIRDMIPAKRDADDALGMYDIVNDVFYTNDGTGTFIGGEYE